MGYKLKVFWTENAIKNLEDIRTYISRYDEDSARRFVNGIYKSVNQLEEFPYSGRKYPFKDDKNLREKIYNKKYRIVYKITIKGIEIFIIAHCSRALDI